jgi:hypothetical protein
MARSKCHVEKIHRLRRRRPISGRPGGMGKAAGSGCQALAVLQPRRGGGLWIGLMKGLYFLARAPGVE